MDGGQAYLYIVKRSAAIRSLCREMSAQSTTTYRLLMGRFLTVPVLEPVGAAGGGGGVDDALVPPGPDLAEGG